MKCVYSNALTMDDKFKCAACILIIKINNGSLFKTLKLSKLSFSSREMNLFIIYY